MPPFFLANLKFLRMLPFYLALDFGGLVNVQQRGCYVFPVCRFEYWLLVLNLVE